MGKKDKTAKLIKKERKFTTVGAILLFGLWVLSFFAKNTLSSVNVEVERLSREVNNQKELASLENVNAVANKEGLAYNNGNIRIITER